VPACVIDEKAPHDLCGHGEKVRAVLPAHLPLIDQLQIRLMDEGGRLKRVSCRSRLRLRCARIRSSS
jgi:hypothetical protein